MEYVVMTHMPWHPTLSYLGLFFLYLGQIDDNLLIECGLPVGQHDEAV